MNKQKQYKSELDAISNAIHRCHNSNYKHFKDYGGRGIVVCDEWRNDRMSFLKHIGPKPSPELTLDRIDNDGNYEPGNVRWATRHEQQANRRKQAKCFLTINGVTKPLNDWAKQAGLKPNTLVARRLRGLSGDALLKPLYSKRLPDDK